MLTYVKKVVRIRKKRYGISRAKYIPVSNLTSPRTITQRFREKRYFKEIAWLLLVKVCLLIAIRIVFFSHPEGKPDGVVMTSAHLLGATPASESRPPSPEKRSSHDQ